MKSCRSVEKSDYGVPLRRERTGPRLVSKTGYKCSQSDTDPRRVVDDGLTIAHALDSYVKGRSTAPFSLREDPPRVARGLHRTAALCRVLPSCRWRTLTKPVIPRPLAELLICRLKVRCGPRHGAYRASTATAHLKFSISFSISGSFDRANPAGRSRRPVQRHVWRMTSPSVKLTRRQPASECV